MNEALPWSEELIDKFIDRWIWGVRTPQISDIGELEFLYETGLSFNKSLPWSSDFIRKYENRWFWYDLSRNSGLPWSYELLIEYEEKWYWEEMTDNEKLWEQVFNQFLDDRTVDNILGEISRKEVWDINNQ
jgi:hypothetical protein